MVITLCGDDNARLTLRLRELLAEHAPPEVADFNLLQLDGAALDLPDLRAACDALPFLGDKRVVVVKGILGRFGDKDADESQAKSAVAEYVKALKEYLPQAPDSTVLIFVERRKLGASALANALKGGSTVEEYSVPTGDALAAHVANRAKEQGIAMDREAASLLARAVADDPRRLEPEMEKLLAYSAGEDRLTAADVRRMVEIPLEVAIWDMTDAMFAHDAAASLGALRTLLERGQPPQQVMGAVASQVRNLVVAEEYKGRSPESLAKEAGMKPFVARKSLGALRNFRPGEPRRVLSALTRLDLATKTGKAELSSALEFLVVEACARRL